MTKPIMKQEPDDDNEQKPQQYNTNASTMPFILLITTIANQR
jgi:hypothetical protein